MRYAKYSLIGLILALLVATVTKDAMAQQDPPAVGDEATLLKVLKSDAPLFDKAKACQQLAVIGTKKSVPTLANLITDQRLSHYARFSLEPISDPSVDEALRASLKKVKGGLLVGVINSIGMRRDAGSTGQLTELLAQSDPAVSAAAVSALGRIATPEAIEILTGSLSKDPPLKNAVADACLTAADTISKAGKKSDAADLYDQLCGAALPKHLHVAALAGSIRVRGAEGLKLFVEHLKSEDDDLFGVALSMAHELPGDGVTGALIAELTKPLPRNSRQARVIFVLGERGDKAALPVVLKIAQEDTGDIRLPAVQVLAKVGDASAVPFLLETAVSDQGALATAALDSLAAIADKSVDAELTTMLKKSVGARQLVLIELAGRREITSAVPVLLDLTKSKDEKILLAAIGALGLTAELKDLPVLLNLLVDPPTPEAGEATKKTLEKACQRMPDRDACVTVLQDQMKGASQDTQSDLLDLVGMVGGKKALESVAAAAMGDDEALQDAATRVLGKWLTPDAAPVLLKLAETDNFKFKNRTLSGYIRIARQLNVSAEEGYAMCRKAMELASRDRERGIALQAMQRYPSIESLHLVMGCLDQPGLRDAAGASAAAIGLRLIDTQPAAVADAMKQVVKTADNEEIKRDARRCLNRANRKLKEGK